MRVWRVRGEKMQTAQVGSLVDEPTIYDTAMLLDVTTVTTRAKAAPSRCPGLRRSHTANCETAR